MNMNIFADSKEEIIKAVKAELPRYEEYLNAHPIRPTNYVRNVSENTLKTQVQKAVGRFAIWLNDTLRGRLDLDWHVDEYGIFHGHVTMLGDKLSSLYNLSDLRCLRGYEYWLEFWRSKGMDISTDCAMIQFQDTYNTRRVIEEDLSMIGAKDFNYSTSDGRIIAYEFTCKAEYLNRKWQVPTVPMGGFRINRVRDNSLIWSVTVQMFAVIMDTMIEKNAYTEDMILYIYAMAHMAGLTTEFDEEVESMMHEDLHKYDANITDEYSHEDIIRAANDIKTKIASLPFNIAALRVVDKIGGHVVLHPNCQYDPDFNMVSRDGKYYCLNDSKNITKLNDIIGSNYSVRNYGSMIDSLILSL